MPRRKPETAIAERGSIDSFGLYAKKLRHLPLIFATFFLLPRLATGQFKICNNTTVSTYSAVSYLADDGNWHTKGWFRLSPWQCETIFSEITNRHYYVHSEEVGGPRSWGNEDWDCVQNNAFDILSNQPCGDANKRGFAHVDVGDGVTDFEHDLTCDDCPAGPPRPSEKPQWQKDLDWSTNDTGPPDCPLDYPYPACLLPFAGNRACLMNHAKQSARDNDCANALRVALVTQCHNDAAAQGIAAAGVYQVCQYLGPPDPPRAPAPPLPPPTPAMAGSPHAVTFINQSGMTLYIYYFIRAGGSVDCRDYASGGTFSPQASANFTIPPGQNGFFVFQKAQDPCPLSTIRSQANIPGGNPHPQTIYVQ